MALSAPDPGAMTARLALEAPEEIFDGQGGVTRTYGVAASLWTRIEPVALRESEQAGAALGIAAYRIWMRYRDDITLAKRFRKGARIFRILGYRDPDETRRFLVCDCEEEKP